MTEALKSSEEILFSEQNGVGCIHLNRPAALNALSEEMIERYILALANWAGRSDIKAVIVDAAGDRAFCAGGDIRALYESLVSQSKEPAAQNSIVYRFFESEYRLNHAIHSFPKPHICLIRGVVMGGGAGISINGSHRIINETARFAMPEVRIGFVPDVGSSFFLNRIAGPEVAAWLASSGEIIAAVDMKMLGLATHIVASDDHEALKQDIIDDGGVSPDAVIAKYQTNPSGESALDLEAIKGAFGAESFSACIHLLEDQAESGPKTDWATARLEALSKGAPLSQAVAVELLRRAAGCDLKDCLKLEFRCGQHLLAHRNFIEGVRCTLIDKGQTPNWQPKAHNLISRTDIDTAFEPPADGDLEFI